VERTTHVRSLIGSGDRIVLATLPSVIVGVAIQVAFPSFFDVGEVSRLTRTIAIVLLIAGVTIWIWSVALILTQVPRGNLITTGPFALVRHPLYTSVSLLVLPTLGFVLGTWLGALIGIAMYVATRIFASAEDAELSRRFGAAWEDYRASVAIPWL
jgi:protein-S-isoprenylcysteine O-methyltransferase Ste14